MSTATETNERVDRHPSLHLREDWTRVACSYLRSVPCWVLRFGNKDGSQSVFLPPEAFEIVYHAIRLARLNQHAIEESKVSGSVEIELDREQPAK